ncbi:hypothetical protein IFM89_032284 [Coptis chinensis]|uniref:BTB domain-containing protein n=1 Tax=Coptis chinensis TaxID=261450 RepID=A0A835LK52_9MAGN|nr:hypothetical protein IFM89_032284 [Coptis chinensis]
MNKNSPFYAVKAKVIGPSCDSTRIKRECYSPRPTVRPSLRRSLAVYCFPKSGAPVASLLQEDCSRHCLLSSCPAHPTIGHRHGRRVEENPMECNTQTSRSPVFKAMLENEMEESISGTIKISEVTYDALHSFVQFLYTAEVSLDEQMACDLLALAEKYQVKHLKSHCENILTSKLNAENVFMCFAFSS